MSLTLFLSVILFTTLVSAATREEDFFVHNHSDDYDDYEYDDEVRNIQTDKPTSAQTKKPAASYEVTEKVDDIPNNVTFTVPVRLNFTIHVPLNNATVNRNITSNKNGDREGFDVFFNGIPSGFDDKFEYPQEHKVKKNLKKNSISIFHVNAEFDDDKDKPVVQNININKYPNYGIFNVKDRVDRFKDGIVNHIYNVNNRDEYDNVNNGFNLPNIVAGPIAFLSKLHKKGSAVASKLHNVIFGNFDDY